MVRTFGKVGWRRGRAEGEDSPQLPSMDPEKRLFVDGGRDAKWGAYNLIYISAQKRNVPYFSGRIFRSPPFSEFLEL